MPEQNLTPEILAAALKHIVEAQRKRWAEYHRKKAEAA